jgi:tetratricopeptide (TPR) repeat protein
MKNSHLVTIALAAVVALPALAQKQPQPKSQKEVEALQAMFGAQEPNARIAAAEGLLQKFADTEFKSIALYLATVSAEQLGDYEKIMLYGERTLEADPKNYATKLVMAKAIAARTREHDLDKEEKLTRAENLAKQGAEDLKTAVKMNPQMSDADWENAKKDFQAQSHEALGMAAGVRKKYDDAIANYKAAMELSGDQVTMVRLGQTYNLAGKPDDAIAVLDKVLALPDANAQVKQVAQAEKARAVQSKTKK